MHICLVTHCFPHTDRDPTGNWIPPFVELVMERGHRCTVLTPRMQTGDRLKDWPFPVRYFTWRGGTRRLGQLKLSRPADIVALFSLVRQGEKALRQILHSEQTDLCLGVWAIPGGYWCRNVSRQLGVPYAVWTLGSDINVYGARRGFRGMVTAVLKDADYLFANSRQLVSRASDISGKSCLFMPTNRILPMDVPPKSGLDAQATKLLYVGRLEAVKGIDVLVEAVLGLLRKQTGIILYILGDGSLRTRLEAMVAQEGRTGQVVFVGWADPATVTAYLKACDVLVIPSRSEGMPVVYWEAMQAGKPVIVTDVGDMAEYTRTHTVGAVASAGDPASLSRAIGDMAAGRVPVNREHIRRLAGEASLGKAVQTFLDTVGSKANS